MLLKFQTTPVLSISGIYSANHSLSTGHTPAAEEGARDPEVNKTSPYRAHSPLGEIDM